MAKTAHFEEISHLPGEKRNIAWRKRRGGGHGAATILKGGYKYNIFILYGWLKKKHPQKAYLLRREI